MVVKTWVMFIPNQLLQKKNNMATWGDIRNAPPQNKWQDLYTMGAGSNVSPTNQVPSLSQQTSNKIVNTGKKLFGPAMSALSLGTEPLADALIRKGGTFKQRFTNALSTGGDMGGALETRGVPTLPATAIGFMGSLALPGLGEVKQVSKFGEVANALKKLKPFDRWQSAINLLSIHEPAVAGEALTELRTLAKDFLGTEKFNKMERSKKWGISKIIDYVDNRITDKTKFGEAVREVEVNKQEFNIPNLLRK